MKQIELLGSISKYFARFKEQVKILNSNGEFSINIHSENILIGILNIVYDCNLENVNYSKNKNYDTIDLRDENRRLTFQITSTSNIKKIKYTLRGYVKNEHYKDYDKIIILILTDRQKKYKQGVIDEILEGKARFEQENDIIDFSTLYVKLNSLNNLDKIMEIERLLRDQFKDDISDVSDDVNTYEELVLKLKSYFEENENVFKSFGPNSGSNIDELLRTDMTLWYMAREEKILPNNQMISRLVKNNKDLIPEAYKPFLINY